MAPSAIDPAPTTQDRMQDVIPPAHLYSVSEAHFRSYEAPRPNGYQQAQAKGADNVAIVIDNGKLNLRDYCNISFDEDC